MMKQWNDPLLYRSPSGYFLFSCCYTVYTLLSTLFEYSILLQILLPQLQLRVIDSHLHTNPCTQLTRKGFSQLTTSVSVQLWIKLPYLPPVTCVHMKTGDMLKQKRNAKPVSCFTLSLVSIFIRMYLNVGQSMCRRTCILQFRGVPGMEVINVEQVYPVGSIESGTKEW